MTTHSPYLELAFERLSGFQHLGPFDSEERSLLTQERPPKPEPEPTPWLFRICRVTSHKWQSPEAQA